YPARSRHFPEDPHPRPLSHAAGEGGLWRRPVLPFQLLRECERKGKPGISLSPLPQRGRGAGGEGHLPRFVMEQLAPPDRRDKEVVVAIVVVVADGHAHAVEGDRKAGLPGDIGERAVAVVVVEDERAARGVGGDMAGPVVSPNDENVEPAVVVVVEERAAAAHRLREPLLAERAVDARAVHSGSLRDVLKLNRGYGRRGRSFVLWAASREQTAQEEPGGQRDSKAERVRVRHRIRPSGVSG